ncbi:diacylglycerol kinase family protein [Lacticaseibacillus daqingensis]|uniref:diacylglycerol kinase family protein n=1 Tax=Lacticaseibacillus daqingensis TaxID=2486014 RepID=UPI000F7B910F|nr:diacylglycerol kinase family protein [Lacticaseibacillus daqingensis]
MASRDKRIAKNHHWLESAKHAMDGLWGTFLHEGNFRRESVFALVVLAAAAVFRVSRFDWFLLLIAILLVFLAELWNTIIEAVVDLVVGERFDVRAKRIKDMSAGAVLIAALIAVVCGLYVFLPVAWRLVG